LLGIIFTGGEGPAVQTVRRLIDTETKGALFAAADSGLQAAEVAGFRPDWIIGDMDSLSCPSRLAEYPQQCVIRHSTAKDYTDTELAFSLVSEKGCDEIWIIGGGGGRIDHLFGIRSLFERDVFPRRWITDCADIRCLEAGPLGGPLGGSLGGPSGGGGCPSSGPLGGPSGSRVGPLDGAKGELSLRLQTGALVSVFPLGGGPWKAHSRGLKWPLDDLIWNRGFFGLSNLATEQNISIKAEAGRFMVILPFPQEEEKQRLQQ